MGKIMAGFRLSYILAIGICLLALAPIPVLANPPPDNPQPVEAGFVYTVQPGDTLSLIALRHNLKIADVLVANNLFNPNLIFPGQPLILPGIEPPQLAQPAPVSAATHLVQPGDTIYSIADQYGVTVGSLVLANHVQNIDLIEVGQMLQIPLEPLPTPNLAQSPIQAITLSEPTIMQGRTLVVRVALTETATLTGTFEGRPVFFHGDGNGQYWGLVAIHALEPPNTYPIVINATLLNGQQLTTFENVTVVDGPYGHETIQFDSNTSALLTPELIEFERERLAEIWSRVTLRPQWEGPFWYPVPAQDLRITSYFGTRRTYNQSDELSFHSGTDFGGDVGLPIYAPAAGTVVLAEPLIVRGNAVVVDHGMGLYSGYWHQSQIAVQEGQQLQPGDLIGYVGNTGLITGPHLHWEMRLNGIAGNTLQWVRESLP